MADNRTFLRLSLATALLAAPLHAQQLADPANLTGEHVSPQSPADTLPINHGAPALQQLLQKLRTRASMLLVVAHPDDEDGGFLTFESRGQGARVGMLTLNRGEGGQNLMTGDFDDALGLLRTQELLAADRYMGVDQFFGTVADFGFSKTKEETLQKWTHDRVLYDAVRVLRLYRPLIVASVFVGGPTDGHGQHQVSGEIAQEAFVAAADPKIFPDMGLPPWAPLKVYARTPFARVTNGTMHDSATGKDMPVLFHNYVTGADLNQPPAPTVQIHEGEASTQLGMSGDTYGAFARRGLSLQKSQIGGNGGGGGRGGGDAGYTLVASRVPCPGAPSPTVSPSETGFHDSSCVPSEQTPFDGIDTSLPSIAELSPNAPIALHQSLVQTLTELNRLVTTAATSLPNHLDASVAPLQTALTSLDKLLAEVQTTSFDATEKFNLQHELRIKRVQLDRALTLALGITTDAVVKPSAPGGLIPGRPYVVRATITTAASSALTLLSATLHIASAHGDSSPTLVQAQATANPTLISALNPLTLTFEDVLPANTPLTRPAFSRPSIEQAFYDVPDPLLRDAPAAPAPLVADIFLRDASGAVIELESAVRLDEAGSTVGQVAFVVPAVSISLSPTQGIVPTGEKDIHFSARVSSASAAQPPAPAIYLESGNKSPGQLLKAVIAGMGPTAGALAVTIPTSEIKPKAFTLRAHIAEARADYSESYRAIGYPGLPFTNYYTPATYKATAVDVITAPRLKVAYLPGTGDDVPAFLPSIGITPTMIAIKDLTADNLKQYDAVILGVRTYAAHPELAGNGSKPLIDYAAAGGVVITQYQNGRYTEAEAPYPITTALSSGDHSHDVVVESQPLTILKPDAPLLSWPNKIGPADFKNWVAEWGHGFAGTWSPKYDALLEVHDPDQDPQEGSLLVAPVGKGAYIYVGLALYRQLPEGVPGAYRLYANLLSYAKNPKR